MRKPFLLGQLSIVAILILGLIFVSTGRGERGSGRRMAENENEIATGKGKPPVCPTPPPRDDTAWGI